MNMLNTMDFYADAVAAEASEEQPTQTVDTTLKVKKCECLWDISWVSLKYYC